MRKPVLFAVAALTVPAVPAAGHGAAAGASQPQRSYTVLFAAGTSSGAAQTAVGRAGGELVDYNPRAAVGRARSAKRKFRHKALRRGAIAGVAYERSIGRAPPEQRPAIDRFALERSEGQRHAGRKKAHKVPRVKPAEEPLSGLQWDMQAIRATPTGSYRVQQASRHVRVAILDTGIDAAHPDIAPNFDAALSRNFTTDIPSIDGPCAEDPGGACTDPANVDEQGHGTHLAGTVGAPLNGKGIGGVAPRADLINLRTGQDSGYFFLQPTVDALTFAADQGVDVVLMTYYVDPWLYNCPANPADAPADRQEQRTIIAAIQRALDYARGRGVTVVAALGNEHTDLGRPQFDAMSPDFPPGSAYERGLDNSCLTLPAEGAGVIGVAAVGPTERKAYYSNYGVEQTDVSAPGGDRREFFGSARYNAPENTVVAPYPEAVARANGELEPDGTANTPFVVRECHADGCAYYQFLQGTSTAAAHVAGVAALAVAEHGHRDKRAGGLRLKPKRVQKIIERSARARPCPEPPLLVYPDPDLGPEYAATCAAGRHTNGFYGHGIVDAFAAVGSGRTRHDGGKNGKAHGDGTLDRWSPRGNRNAHPRNWKL